MTALLDIVALRSLVAVADRGGFHRAADSLALSQSAVSCVLIDRAGKGQVAAATDL
jgi:Bacterial regulatory helix-turn-helix protein, lysR family